MSLNEVEELKAEVKKLKAKLANADKVIQDAAAALGRGDMSSIWAGSGIHQQIELYLNPVIIDESENNEARKRA